MMGSSLFPPISGDQELLADGFEDAVGIAQHVVVPEAQYPIAVGLDDLGPRRIPHRIVLTPVKLDRQPRRAAGEVGDVAVDLELADELLAFEATRAEVVPEALLGFGLVGAKLAGDRSQAFPCQLRAPSPNPLPVGERAVRRRGPSTPSPRRGKGWGEGARHLSTFRRTSISHQVKISQNRCLVERTSQPCGSRP